MPQPEGIIFIPALADQDRKIDGNMGATLYDMGDGVGCVSFHTKMNALDNTILEVIATGCDMVDAGELVGLVVGNDDTNFSVGANIGLFWMLAMSKDWDMRQFEESEWIGVIIRTVADYNSGVGKYANWGVAITADGS